MLIKLIQGHLRVFPPLYLYDYPDPFPVRLVADVGDGLYLLILHQLGNTLDELRLIDLERYFGDDNALPIALLLLLNLGSGS